MSEEQDFLNDVWYPLFLDDLFAMENVQKAWVQAVTTNNITERANLIRSISATINEAYNTKKKELGL